MKRLILLSLAILTFSGHSAADEPEKEPEKTTILDEVVVTDKRAWIEGEKVVFVPTKSEKNLATDAVSLIEQMGLSLLRVENSTIRTADGSPVTIYVNGRPVGGSELATFWPKNARRVEYIMNPTDPRFAGATNVVNFIMKEYTAGGLTKLSATQRFPGYGYYAAASKLVYKTMTYIASFNGNYNRDHRIRTSTEDSYRGIFAADGYHDLVTATNDDRSKASRSDVVSAEFFAGHYDPARQFLANHTASVSWDRDPGSYALGSTAYNPPVLGATSFESRSHGRNLGVQASGIYWKPLGREGSLQAYWHYSHHSNDSYTSYAESGPAGTSAFANQARETVDRFCVNVRSQLNLSPGKLYLMLMGTVEPKWYRTHYTGTATATSRLFRADCYIVPALTWLPSQKATLSLIPRLEVYTHRNDSQRTLTDVHPGLVLTGNFRMNTSNMLTCGVRLTNTSPSSSQISDVLLRQSELMWLEGSPALKPQQQVRLDASYSWMPSSVIDLTAVLEWIHDHNPFITDYRAGGPLHEGVIRQYRNGGNQGHVGVYPSITVRPFKGFRIDLNGYYTHHYATGLYRGTLDNIKCRARVSYTIRDFSFSYHISTPGKSMSGCGTTVSRSEIYDGFTARWGNGNLNASLMVSGIAARHRKETVTMNTAAFGQKTVTFTDDGYIQIGLTYTFDYGRKIDPDTSTGSSLGTDSSILR